MTYASQIRGTDTGRILRRTETITYCIVARGHRLLDAELSRWMSRVLTPPLDPATNLGWR